MMNETGFVTFVMKQISRLLCFQNIITCLHTLLTNTCSKLKAEHYNYMLTMVKANNKNTRTVSNFEHMQMNLHFFIVNFEHVFVRFALDKIHRTT